MDILQQPWPWYIAGPLIGLMVPLLLILGNKPFGISANLRHICAACYPAKIPFFDYNWKKESWNLFFAAGIIIGGFIAWNVFQHVPGPLNPKLTSELQQFGISKQDRLLPAEVFAWQHLLSARGLIMIVGGGFFIGFGTRYAGGCTSGHSIMGMSNLQWPSLVATICFMAGGFLVANILLPVILSL
ncbi:MAG TPA: YeeE/YedE thiosulfate transporter family protein [Chitinophagaceae bacterium]